MDREHGNLGRNHAEVVDADFTTILPPPLANVYTKIFLITQVVNRELRPKNYRRLNRFWSSTLRVLFKLLYKFRHVELKKYIVPVGHILKDIVRTFEPITRTDIRRAVWTWCYRRDSVDPLFASFTIFVDAISQEFDNGSVSFKLKILGDVLWRTAQIPRSPSPPPPPYSLFDLTSPTDNFALVYHPMPMLPPPAFSSIEDSTDSASSRKRKRTKGAASDDSERLRKRARQQRALKNPAMRYDLRPRITEIA